MQERLTMALPNIDQFGMYPLVIELNKKYREEVLSYIFKNAVMSEIDLSLGLSVYSNKKIYPKGNLPYSQLEKKIKDFGCNFGCDYRYTLTAYEGEEYVTRLNFKFKEDKKDKDLVCMQYERGYMFCVDVCPDDYTFNSRVINKIKLDDEWVDTDSKHAVLAYNVCARLDKYKQFVSENSKAAAIDKLFPKPRLIKYYAHVPGLGEYVRKLHAEQRDDSQKNTFISICKDFFNQIRS